MAKTHWIWCNKANNIDEYAEFYGAFFYREGKVFCDLSCDGDYVLYVNGKFVASNQYGDFEHYKIYDRLELTEYVREGKNDFAVLVWHFGESTHRYVRAVPAVYFRVEGEGNALLLQSDEHILSRLSRGYESYRKKLLSRQLGFTFSYDANKEDDWINGNGEGFAPSVVREKQCSLFPRPIEKLRLGVPTQGKLLRTENESYWLFDLGAEKVGLPYLRLTSSAAQTLKISYGEYLLNGGVKAKFDDYTDFTFTYGAKAGENDFTSYMLRLGCRYLEIHAQSPIEVESVGIIPQYYPVNAVACHLKNSLDDEIYKLCLNTLELCMMEHYVDCPWREQGLYTFDARNQMLCGYYAFEGGNYGYARANLLLMAKDEREDGLLSITFPCGTPLTIPAYSLHYIIALKEYVEYSGDTTLALEVEDKIRRILNTFVGNMQGDLVYSFAGKDKWNFYDWTKYTKGTTGTKEGRAELILNALMLLALKAFAWICERVGIPYGYEGLAERIRTASRSAFYRESGGAFALTETDNDYVVLGNSLAILSDMATREEGEEIARKLCSGELFACSLCMKPFLYDALLQVDESYASYIVESIRADYGKMLDEGATTAWETADGYKALGGTGSLCHGWSAIPVYYYWKIGGKHA